MFFVDRKDAGERLASQLVKYKNKNPYIFGLPRGGVPVAYEVAKALDAPLDTLTTRKLGAPLYPEFGFGAIAPNGIEVINHDVVKRLGLTKRQIMQIKQSQRTEMERRIKKYRGTLEMPDLKGKTVILVDDGIATGVTIQAAVRYLKTFRPQKLVIAVPVGAPDSVKKLQKEVDEVICLYTPDNFNAVGQWYQEFDQTSDEEVLALLNKKRPGHQTRENSCAMMN